jgi:hypothetical protein
MLDELLLFEFNGNRTVDPDGNWKSYGVGRCRDQNSDHVQSHGRFIK